MGKIALVGDVHSNLEALIAVLEDIDERGITEIIFLGDLVNYGPDANRCVEDIRALSSNGKQVIVLQGNNDEAVSDTSKSVALLTAMGFNLLPAVLVEWTRKQLDTDHLGYLRQLPKHYRLGDFSFVHGSPTNHLSGHINPMERDSIDGALDSTYFCAHTHRPFAFVQHGRLRSSEEIEYGEEYDLIPGSRYCINVGSVGQPRDHIQKACYVILDVDKNTVCWVRVGYDIGETARKMAKALKRVVDPLFLIPHIGRLSDGSPSPLPTHYTHSGFLQSFGGAHEDYSFLFSGR